MNELLMNEENYLRVANFLARQAQRFNLDGSQMARMKPMPSELLINAQITAGGTVPLLTGNSTQEVGVTNFDGNRLETGRFFIIDALTLLYGEAGADKKVWEVDYTKPLPAVLKSANFILRQNGETIIKLPISSIAQAQKNDSENGYRRLGALALLEPNQTVEASIEFPAGSSITPSGNNKSFVSVLLRGFETYLKR